jgi:mRNA interferase MazF
LSTPIKTLSDLGKNMNFEVKYTEPKRGEIYQVDLNNMSIGTVHILGKSRPGIIIQNDKGCQFSPTVIIALISSNISKIYPMQYKFNLNNTDSVIMFEQIMTLDKNRLVEKLGELTKEQMIEADKKLMFSLELNQFGLENVLDIDVHTMNLTKTKEGSFYNFGIDLLFEGNLKKEIIIKLDKLKQFDKSIDENIEFLDLKKRLDCCRGLNYLVKNGEMK